MPLEARSANGAPPQKTFVRRSKKGAGAADQAPASRRDASPPDSPLPMEMESSPQEQSRSEGRYSPPSGSEGGDVGSGGADQGAARQLWQGAAGSEGGGRSKGGAGAASGAAAGTAGSATGAATAGAAAAAGAGAAAGAYPYLRTGLNRRRTSVLLPQTSVGGWGLPGLGGVGAFAGWGFAAGGGGARGRRGGGGGRSEQQRVEDLRAMMSEMALHYAERADES
ncbi:hypothetical protein FOA52_008478 [Chlamydomonas sp. UWO 241]|nr:hypothetical protein FOA52_008478 [Chlamydomonas sp. UWO 241]